MEYFGAKFVELKFAQASDTEGTIEGLGAVFGNRDSHGDQIEPGAFAHTIAEHKAAKTMPAMYAEHSRFIPGGDLLPVGRWDFMEETREGLRMKGRLVGMKHPDVQRIADLCREDVLNGLSIGFQAHPQGFVMGKSVAEPRRRLTRIHLMSVDLTADPSNSRARVTDFKSIMVQADHQTATEAIKAMMQLHSDSLSHGNSPTVEQRSDLWRHMIAAHKALTGIDVPVGLKSQADTIRAFEEYLMSTFGWSNDRARAVAAHGFKAADRRDDGGKPADTTELKAAVGDLSTVLKGFSLSS